MTCSADASASATRATPRLPLRSSVGRTSAGVRIQDVPASPGRDIFLSCCWAHDLIRKSVPTFRDHALGGTRHHCSGVRACHENSFNAASGACLLYTSDAADE